METSVGGKALFCQHCGEPLAGDVRFCIHCGTPAGAAGADLPQGSEWPHPSAQTLEYRCQWCDTRRRDASEALDSYCPVCRRLDPLGPDYSLPVETYIWALDAQAMATLRSITPLTMAAQALSEQVGRPWLESAVNGIRLGPDQLPDIFALAVRAARIVGLTYLPEIYVSGEQMWDCMTLGSQTQAFIVIGSIIANFKEEDMLYILGREMGHIAAGHALWKTLVQFTSGRQQNKTIMGHGVMQFLNPAKIVESAIDAPLMAWARHAEITADRAGALVVGNRSVAQRVAIQLSLKSFPLYPRLNIAALEREIAQSDDRQLRVSEWTMSSTPYLARRLRIMDDFFASGVLIGWRAIIDHWLAIELAGAALSKTIDPTPPAPVVNDGIRLTCTGCNQVMRISRAELKGKTEVHVRCPNHACGKILAVTPKPSEARELTSAVLPPLRLTCPVCHDSMQVPAANLTGKFEIQVRCPSATCRAVFTVRMPSGPSEGDKASIGAPRQEHVLSHGDVVSRNLPQTASEQFDE